MAKSPEAVLDCARVAYDHDADFLFVRESYDIRDKPDVWDAFHQVSRMYN